MSRLGIGLVALLFLSGQGQGAVVYQPAAFDLRAARDASTLEVRVGPSREVRGVKLTELTYQSLAVDQPIRIHAYVAVPLQKSARPRPAILAAHGLGAQADPDEAVELAANLDVIALALSAPGTGKSEGSGPTADDPRPIFAGAARDIRHSWLYQYAYAMMRGITYLASRDDVDGRQILVTGFSMGGLASFIVGGADDRVKATVPVAACGSLARLADEPTWFRRLVLAAGGLKPTDPDARAVFSKLDPIAWAGRQKGETAMLIGAQDEFFTLDGVVATWRALRGRSRSLEVFADYDHGWYFGGGCTAACMSAQPEIAQAGTAAPAVSCKSDCPRGCATAPYCGPQTSYNHQDDFWTRWSATLRGLLRDQPPPPMPFVQRTRGEVVVRLPTVPVRAVRVAISTDGGYTFAQLPVEKSPTDGAYHLRRSIPPSAVVIAEVETTDGQVASSLPQLPPGFRPHVRPFGPPPH